MRNRWLAPAGLAAAALVVAACGSSTSSGGTGGGSATSPSAAPATSGAAAAAAGTTLESAKVGGKTLLTNSKGFTLYWFAPDTPTKSKCYGGCATYWPPVPAPATAMAGVKGTIGEITRSNGTKQATFNGHPLYTYAGDTKPGEAKGNNVNASGGLWYDISLSSSTAAAPKPKKSNSGGGSYGY
jgi:predicted lipoprotein with Yx(FWY)xxD motif